MSLSDTWKAEIVNIHWRGRGNDNVATMRGIGTESGRRIAGRRDLVPAELDERLRASAEHHRHLCPRQVLGVRMGLLAGSLLEMALRRDDKRLLAIIETDGCFADGISAATGCSVGHRTLRVEDLGKVAATFVDVQADRGIRVAPHPDARRRAQALAPGETNRWAAYLVGYQRMSTEELLVWREVRLVTPAAELISRPGHRASCEICREEIINERQVADGNRTLCRSCAGASYYSPVHATEICAAERQFEFP